MFSERKNADSAGLISPARRRFLRTASAGAAAAFLQANLPLRLWAEPDEKSVVAIARRAGSGRELAPQTASDMVSAAVAASVGQRSAARAWQDLFGQRDTVAVKLNCLAPGLAPHREIVDGIVAGLKSAGVREENIVLWDMETRQLERCGYRKNLGAGVKCYGTDGAYEPEIEFMGPVGSLFSTIVARTCTALVNVPVLKDHNLAGVTIGLKNFYGAIHNPNKYHDNNCDPYIAHVNSHPLIRKKLRLTVCDAIVAQYNGGPSSKPDWAWPMESVLASVDPVALDAVGAQIIEDKRKENGLPSLQAAGRPARHIASAAEMKLGRRLPGEIRIVEA